MQNIPMQGQGAPRKLRKIKRPIQQGATPRPVSFGTPTKVNFAQMQQTSQQQSAPQQGRFTQAQPAVAQQPTAMSQPAAPQPVSAPQSNWEQSSVASQQQVSTYNPNTPTDNYYNSRNGAENIKIADDDELISREPETISDVMKNKTVMMLMILAALIGAVSSYLFAASKGNSSGTGLDGIVLNQDVPPGRNRCGLVEKRQGCVLYIMNPKNIEVTARDFYATAAKWTERERYLIETGNMHYASTRIKPGYIAQINIPPLSY